MAATSTSPAQPRRAAPPPATLAWVVGAVGGRRIDRVRRLRGATSSVLHEVVVDGQAVVLRRYLHPAWRPAGPELVAQEVAALRAAGTAPLAAPRLLAADPSGEAAGAPLLLMTRLPGRPVVAARPGWIGALAEVHIAMAGWQEPAGALPDYQPWVDPGARPPTWTRQRAAWEQAIALVTAGLPWHRAWQPLHRDLHPGNVLLRRGRVTGVVDWVNACRGPFESDLAQCRVNLAVLAGLEAADAFLAATGEVGAGYDPAWDLVVAVSLLPDPSTLTALTELGATITPRQVHARLDELVARAVATRR